MSEEKLEFDKFDKTEILCNQFSSCHHYITLFKRGRSNVKDGHRSGSILENIESIYNTILEDRRIGLNI